MLLANQSTLMQCPVRFMAGSTTSVEPQLRRNWNQGGRNRNKMYRSQTTGAYPLWSIALGYYPPYTWQLPQAAGYMSAHDGAAIGIAHTTTPVLLGGVTSSPTATFGISTNTPDMLPTDTTSPLRTCAMTIGVSILNADGQLIATVQPGDAPAAFGFATNNPALAGVLSADGSTSFGFTTNTPILGALGGMIVSVTFGINIGPATAFPTDDTSPLRTATASIGITAGPSTILPTDDTAPARTATATIGIDGALLGHALGEMVGTTAEAGVTVDNVVNGVWNALLADYQLTGSAGKALSTAGAGGVDYGALADAVRTELTTELTRIIELAKIHGLVIGSDLVVTSTTRAAGSVTQTINDASGTVTVTRT